MPSRRRNATRNHKQQDDIQDPPLLNLDDDCSSPAWTPPATQLEIDSEPDPDELAEAETEIQRPLVAGTDAVDDDLLAESHALNEENKARHDARFAHGIRKTTGTPEEDPSPVRAPPAPQSPSLSPPPRAPSAISPVGGKPKMGHVRSPVLTREPTMLETFSRTVRGYASSAIPVPTAAPSPPRVSKPVSFGSFLPPGSPAPVPSSVAPPSPSVVAQPQLQPAMYSRNRGPRRSSGAMSPVSPEMMRYPGHGHGHGYDPSEVDQAATFLEDEDERSAYGAIYPTLASGDGDAILWSRWDTLDQGDSKQRRLLFLGYTTGFQIWDCTDLGSIYELLNIRGSLFGHVAYAGVLAHPGKESPLADAAPLIGVVSHAEGESTMYIYSLRTHDVVERLPFRTVSTFTSSKHFLVISTYHPPTLHVLSAATLAPLHAVPSELINAFAPAQTSSSTTINHQNVNSNNHNHNQHVSVSPLDPSPYGYPAPSFGFAGPSPGPGPSSPYPPPDTPLPVFALSGRLLAFASAPRHADSVHRLPAQQPRTGTGRPSSASMSSSSSAAAGAFAFPSAFGVSGEAVGSAALKVGSSVLGGVMSLGGRVVGSARGYYEQQKERQRRESDAQRYYAQQQQQLQQQQMGYGYGGARGGGQQQFHSRSAPAGSVGYASPPLGTSRAPSAMGSPRAPTMDLGVAGSAVGAGGGGLGLGGIAAAMGGVGLGQSGGGGPVGDALVTVLDLKPLLEAAGHNNINDDDATADDAEEAQQPQPRVVAEFVALANQQASHVAFMPDGNGVLVAPRDGQVARVFQIRPGSATRAASFAVAQGRRARDGSGHAHSRKHSAASLGAGAAVVSGSPGRSVGMRAAGVSSGVGDVGGRVGGRGDGDGETAWHVYELRRGRTSAAIASVETARDGRWVALGTQHRTVHVFAPNPYGGVSDVASHVQGRVRNVLEVQPLSVELAPLVRLRAPKQTQGTHTATLAHTFLSSTYDQHALPASLRPVTSDAGTGSSLFGAQDVLVFDPADGTLSLRRIVLEQRARGSVPGSGHSRLGSGSGAGGAAGAVLSGISGIATSISLPGSSGGAGKLSASPPAKAAANAKSGLTQMMEPTLELVAREVNVATWPQLRRGADWEEVRGMVVRGRGGGTEVAGKREGKAISLSYAELSTSSRSLRLVPRAVYLAHQFSFYSLGEDYAGLLRRYRLSITGPKIDVRREVEPSAANTSEFIEGMRDLQRTSRTSAGAQAHSFDESLASAIGAGIERSPSGRAPIPMLPNGGSPGGARGGSLKGSIPIRGVADGVSGSLGRIRREIGRVRSPRLGPSMSADSASAASALGGSEAGSGEGVGEEKVPLEFDETDEDFWREVTGEVGTGTGTSASTRSDTVPDTDTDSRASVGHGRQSVQSDNTVTLMSSPPQGAWAGMRVHDPAATIRDMDYARPAFHQLHDLDERDDEDEDAEEEGDDEVEDIGNPEWRATIADAEMFAGTDDDGDVLGLMDEEQAPASQMHSQMQRQAQVQAQAQAQALKAEKGKKKKKRTGRKPE